MNSEQESAVVEYRGLTFEVSGPWQQFSAGFTQGDPSVCYPAEGGDFVEYSVVTHGDVTDVLASNDLAEIVDKAREQIRAERGER